MYHTESAGKGYPTRNDNTPDHKENPSTGVWHNTEEDTKDETAKFIKFFVVLRQQIKGNSAQKCVVCLSFITVSVFKTANQKRSELIPTTNFVLFSLNIGI